MQVNAKLSQLRTHRIYQHTASEDCLLNTGTSSRNPFSLCVWNVVSLEFVWRYLSISPLMIPWPVPGGWADEACTYCWVLLGLIWVLISRMPSLANLSPLYKHRSRNVISSVENSVVKLMHGCKSHLQKITLLFGMLFHICVCGSRSPIGPLVAPSLHVNRFVVIPKGHSPGKWRLITDVSHPPGGSDMLTSRGMSG